MSKTGIKGLLYKFFRKKEQALYKASDFIGCMSPANVNFVLEHNPEIDATRVEVAPNSIEAPCPPKGENFEKESEDDKVLRENNERYYIRKKYNLPIDKPIFIYGGNLGKPQGIDYLIKCMDVVKGRTDCHFVVVGTGTEYDKLEAWYNDNLNLNVKLMKGLPKADYDLLVRSCDVGMIFLDHRFTIPNYPSRLLSYLENKMPVLCATDVNTDIGKIAEENGYGYWCESVKVEDFTALVDKMLASDRKAMGERGYEFLKQNYLVEHTYNAIMAHFK
jgi:glycosyltransferase involved in cell wall biosynthesis